eukprot:1158997-Pelagomonas_calceolata.AAC.2
MQGTKDEPGCQHSPFALGTNGQHLACALTCSKLDVLAKFCVTATVKSRLSTACHHPFGTYTISPGPCAQDDMLDKQDMQDTHDCKRNRMQHMCRVWKASMGSTQKVEDMHEAQDLSESRRHA